MKLSQLQRLSEANLSTAQESARLERILGALEQHLLEIEYSAEEGPLAQALKKHGHPATEVKAFLKALNTAHEELQELTQTLITNVTNN